MKTSLAVSSFLLMLTGCAYHPQPVSVYGHSGVPYTAPTICAALTKCLATEAACYYDTSSYSTATGAVLDSNKCVEVKR